MNEIVEVWCTNDASNAVGVVDGTSYCATCFAYASASKAVAASMTDDELVEAHEAESDALAAYASAGGRAAVIAYAAEIARRGIVA